MKNNPFIWFIVSLLISCIVAIGFWIPAFQLVCYIDPPYHDGHMGMPIGQAIYSMAITAVASVVVLVLLFKKMKKKYS